MATRVGKEMFADRRCRSRRSSRSFRGRKSWFSNVENRLLSFEVGFDGNRVDCRTLIGRSGNRSKAGENAGDTPATTAKPGAAERGPGYSVAKPSPQMLARRAVRYRAQHARASARRGK